MFRRFPPPIFPSIWDRLSGLAAINRLVIHYLSLDELEHIDPDTKEWASQHLQKKGSVRDMNADLTELADKFPALQRLASSRFLAAPFIAAMARREGFIAVCEGRFGSAEDPRLPFLCRDRGVTCIRLNELFAKEKWTF